MTTNVPTAPENEPPADVDAAGSKGTTPPDDDAVDSLRCLENGGVHLKLHMVWILCLVLTVLFAGTFVLGRAYEVPGPLEFWKVAAQPLGVVTAGLLALAAAGITFRAHRRTSDSATESARLQREKEIHTESLERCWTRFLWVVGETSTDGDPLKGSVFSPDVATLLIGALLEEAAALKDRALILVIAQYSSEASTSWRIEQSRRPTTPPPGQ
ncbi:hypothetical protein ABIB34_004228 [Rhodococcus sp. UYP5]